MINASEIALIVAICAIVLLIIVIVLGVTYSNPKTHVETPRKASRAPLRWGYRPLDSFQVQEHPQDPPKAPTGSGGGSS